MLWNFFNRDGFLELGEKARRLHSAWLTKAINAPPDRIPRIPLRRVSDGGYSGMMRTEEGRAWAEMWWETAILRVDHE